MRLLAVQGGWPQEVALQAGQPGTARAAAEIGALAADRKVAQANGADLREGRRAAPDLSEALAAQTAAR